MLNHTTKKVFDSPLYLAGYFFCLVCVCLRVKRSRWATKGCGEEKFCFPPPFPACLRRRERESSGPSRPFNRGHIYLLSLKSHRWLSRTCSSSSSSSPSWPLECVSPSSHLQLCDFPSSRTRAAILFFFFNKNAIRNKRNKCVLLHNNSRARHRHGKLSWGESTTKTTTDWIFRICRYYDPRADISMK